MQSKTVAFAMKGTAVRLALSKVGGRERKAPPRSASRALIKDGAGGRDAAFDEGVK